LRMETPAPQQQGVDSQAKTRRSQRQAGAGEDPAAEAGVELGLSAQLASTMSEQQGLGAVGVAHNSAQLRRMLKLPVEAGSPADELKPLSLAVMLRVCAEEADAESSDKEKEEPEAAHCALAAVGCALRLLEQLVGQVCNDHRRRRRAPGIAGRGG
jgi:hypothetical protein